MNVHILYFKRKHTSSNKVKNKRKVTQNYKIFTEIKERSDFEKLLEFLFIHWTNCDANLSELVDTF